MATPIEGTQAPVVQAELLSMDVAQPCEEYTRMEVQRAVGRTLMGGTAAMRAARETYLPKKTAESEDAYEKRLATSVLYNAFKRAVLQLVGKVFAKPIELEDGDADMEKWWEDIDLQGNSADVFARRLFESVLAEGMAYILVDYPPVSGRLNQTVQDVKLSGERPYWVMLKSAQVIGWRIESSSGIPTLTQVRILEVVKVPKGMFASETVQQVRVLEPGGWQIWRKQDDNTGTWKLHDLGATSLDFIPLVPVCAESSGLMESEPPMQDLADLNIKHWQSQSAQDHILDYTRFPILFGRMLGLEEGASIKMGPNNLITSESETAELKHVEHTGASIEAGRSSINDLEGRMAFLALEPMLKQQSGSITATKTSVDTSSASSSLMAWAVSLKDSLEQAIKYMAAYSGGTPGKVMVDFDFVLSLSAEDGALLLQSFQAKAISRAAYCDELKRRAILSDDYDTEADGQIIQEDGEAAMVAQAKLMEKTGMLPSVTKPKPKPGSGNPPDKSQGKGQPES